MPQPGQTPHDVDGVELTLARVKQAWESGDADAYAECFTDDAGYVAYDGSQMIGRQSIADGHRALFAGIMRGSRMTSSDRRISFLGEGTAVVTETGGIIMSWQMGRSAPSPRRRSTVTFVLARRDGSWLVASFQNTRYRPWNKTVLGRILAWSSRRRPQPPPPGR